eukprot:6190586-Pleurochrysis_carterae.AAC.2
MAIAWQSSQVSPLVVASAMKASVCVCTFDARYACYLFRAVKSLRNLGDGKGRSQSSRQYIMRHLKLKVNPIYRYAALLQFVLDVTT